MDTFSKILIQLLNSSNMYMRDLYRVLESKDANISYPALGAYKSFNSVPSFDKARMILDAFEYEISDEDLAQILQYSRDELKAMREEDPMFFQQGIRLSPNAFGESMTVSELRVMIDNRISELSPSNGNFNSYVTSLIKEDLMRSGYLKRKED